MRNLGAAFRRAPPLYPLVKGKGSARALRPALDRRGSCCRCPAESRWSFNKEDDNMISANLTSAQRKAIYRREGWRCALCDSTKYLQIHHIIQRSQGGSNHPHNLIALCSDCHALAHGMDLRGLVDVEMDRPIDQAIVEYMADLYACEGVIWCPWLKEGKGTPSVLFQGDKGWR